jgi:hypothetical protein
VALSALDNLRPLSPLGLRALSVLVALKRIMRRAVSRHEVRVDVLASLTQSLESGVWLLRDDFSLYHRLPSI